MMSNRPINSTGRKSAPDMRTRMRIATWNVLIIAKPGYPEAIARELLRFDIRIAGLTETFQALENSRLVTF